MRLKKARIVIQSISDVKKEWKKALSGQVKSIQDENTIVFTSLKSLSKVLTPGRLEILATVLKEKPESIYALAKLVSRDFKNVHTDVKVLEEAGFLELKVSGPRDSVRPMAKYSGFELDLAA